MAGAGRAVGNPLWGCPRDCGQPALGLSRGLGSGCGEQEPCECCPQPVPMTRQSRQPGQHALQRRRHRHGARTSLNFSLFCLIHVDTFRRFPTMTLRFSSTRIRNSVLNFWFDYLSGVAHRENFRRCLKPFSLLIMIFLRLLLRFLELHQ